VVAGAEPAASTIAFQAGFRGTAPNGYPGDSASLVNSEAPAAPADASTSVSTTTAAASTASDPALEIAIETVRNLPAAQL
jgi:hypothetical protein